MKKTHTTIRNIALFCLLSVGVLQAQLINNMYFLDNSPFRHHYNPSFQPQHNVYIGLPLFNNLQFNFQSDFPTYKDAGFNRGHVFNIEADKAQLLSAFNLLSLANAEAQLSLLKACKR